MGSLQSNIDIIQALAENEVQLQFTPKVLWLRKSSSVVNVANPDLCIKFSDRGNDKAKALIEGLRLLGIEV